MGEQVQKARELQLFTKAIIYQTKKKSCQYATILFCTNLVTNQFSNKQQTGLYCREFLVCAKNSTAKKGGHLSSTVLSKVK